MLGAYRQAVLDLGVAHDLPLRAQLDSLTLTHTLSLHDTHELNWILSLPLTGVSP